MTSSLNFPKLYLVCLFKFGKLSTMKHTVASAGLIADNIHTKHCTCDIPSVYINYMYHNTQV